MGVGIQREGRIGVSQNTGQCLGVHAAGKGMGGEGVPLRYNYDKPEKPRISRVFGYLARFFHPFPNRKIEPRSSYEVVIS